MCTKIFTFLLLFVGSSVLFSQSKERFSISGYAKIIIGNDTLPSKDLILELKPDYHIIETDSLGFFEFKDLKQGNYKLKFVYDGSKNNKFNIKIEHKSVDNFSIIHNSNCQFNKTKALEDINTNNIRLLVIGGFVPYYHNDDKIDEKKFNFKYYIFGCTIEDFECMKQYNQTIFKFLDKKYGEKWRNQVREDVYFLNSSMYGE